MNNTREKLIELIEQEYYCSIEELADHLIANGVTLDNQVSSSKWIPITERLPDTQGYDWVLAQITFIPDCLFGVPVVSELRNGVWYDLDDRKIEAHGSVKVTHWMPLPQPPKGE